MNIGERIKKRRQALGLSVDEVAQKLGKNRATIYRYESNSIEKLPTQILEPLAKALNTTPAYLLGWDESHQGYYTDPETAAYAEELRTNPNLRIMFSAAKDITKEQMQKTVEYIEFLKSKEKGNSDEY